MGRTATLAVAVCALGVSGACSDDEDPAAAPTTASTEASPDGSDCASTGDRTVTVPDVSGEPLQDAIRIVKDGDLEVVGDGVPGGDPTGATAVVRAQEPPAGEVVPPGACVGFRTKE